MSIRNIAIGLIEHKGKMFVAEGRDDVKGEIFYRPLGGGIEFGELAAATLAREFDEELGADIDVIKHLHTFENLFTFNGKAGHEIVFLMSANFKDASMYERDNIPCNEEGVSFIAKWVDKTAFTNGLKTLYPEGLSDYLQRSQTELG